MRRTTGLVAGLLALVMVAAACGGAGGGGDGVASLEGQDDPAVAAGDLAATDDTGTTSTVGELSSEEAMLAFTQCMRDEGVDIADPEIDADGNLRLSRPEGLQEGDFESVRAARDACGGLLDGVVQNFRNADQTELQDQLLAYAQCIRDNGYENIEDPDLSGFGPGRGGQQPGDGGGPFGDIDRTDPAFQAADATCREIFGDGLGPRGFGGRGPGG